MSVVYTCEYCGRELPTNKGTCPGCGAGNPNYKKLDTAQKKVEQKPIHKKGDLYTGWYSQVLESEINKKMGDV